MLGGIGVICYCEYASNEIVKLTWENGVEGRLETWRRDWWIGKKFFNKMDVIRIRSRKCRPG